MELYCLTIHQLVTDRQDLGLDGHAALVWLLGRGAGTAAGRAAVAGRTGCGGEGTARCVGWGGGAKGLFVGPEEAVDALVAVCREGPKSALVDDIKIEAAQGLTPANFQIKPTV